MKIKLIFSIALVSLLSIGSGNAQESTDDATKAIDIVQFKAIYEFIQKVEKEREAIVFTDTMELKIGNNWSVYKDWKQDLKDSLLLATRRDIDSRRKLVVRYATRDEFITNSSEDIGFMSKSWNTSSIYKDRGSNKIITIDDIKGVGPVKSEELASQTWEITDDTTSIKGYLCNKATTSFRGRDYSAWFALDIPINDGPWKFYGLPGLILKVEDKEHIFKFSLVGLEKVDNGTSISIDESPEYTECTLEQYNKLKRNSLKETDYFNFQGTTLRLYSGDNFIAYDFLEK